MPLICVKETDIQQSNTNKHPRNDQEYGSNQNQQKDQE